METAIRKKKKKTWKNRSFLWFSYEKLPFSDGFPMVFLHVIPKSNPLIRILSKEAARPPEGFGARCTASGKRYHSTSIITVLKKAWMISGWWYTCPTEKYESQLGWLFQIDGKIKNVPNHHILHFRTHAALVSAKAALLFQTTNQDMFCVKKKWILIIILVYVYPRVRATLLDSWKIPTGL